MKVRENNLFGTKPLGCSWETNQNRKKEKRKKQYSKRRFLFFLQYKFRSIFNKMNRLLVIFALIGRYDITTAAV